MLGWLRGLMLLLVAVTLDLTGAALAQTAPVEASPFLEERARQLPELIRGDIKAEEYFTPEFLAAVPAAQVRAISASILTEHGAPPTFERLEPVDAISGRAFIGFARSTGMFQISIDPRQNGRVAGLLVTNFTTKNDSIAAILDTLRALPGETNLLVTRYDGDRTQEVVAHQADRALAMGSTFKLYILAELAAQAQRGSLRWDSVTPLKRRSFSSAASGTWPLDAPVTLHTLASWMISVSDNAATDVLIDKLGRDAIGKRLESIGNSAPDRTLPFLNTVEAFALKSPRSDTLRQQYLAASEIEQRRLLASAADQLTLAVIDPSAFVGKPLYIDSIEWFGNAHDLSRLLAHFRDPAQAMARGVMAISPGVSADVAKRWAYVGYKGGSESGVISMSYLLQSRGGHWYTATASWNNKDAVVDNNRFIPLMHRLIDQLATDDAAEN